MSNQRPLDIAFLQLRHRDLAGKSTIRLIKHILRRHLQFLSEMFPCQEQIERRRGNDDVWIITCSEKEGLAPFHGEDNSLTNIRIQFGVVEVLDNLGDGLDRTIPARSFPLSVIDSTAPPSLSLSVIERKGSHLEIPTDKKSTTHLDAIELVS